MVIRNIRRVGFFTNLRYILSDLVFELRYGLDTISTVQLQNLDIESENRVAGNYYQGTNHHVFQRIFSQIQLDPSHSTFIDLGSGKGKALFLASETGFRKVIGVEFSKELVEISTKNLEKFRKKTNPHAEFQIVCGDASEFPIPADVNLVYFANPFNQNLTKKVIGNILHSHQLNPRPIWVIHLYPRGNLAFTKHRAFKLQFELDEEIFIYRFEG